MEEDRRGWFVPPDVVRLPLGNGGWLDVKAELTIGEVMDLNADLVADRDPVSGLVQVDLKKAPFARLVAYIVGWSALDAEGRPQPFSESALRGVFPDRYADIVKAVDAHIATVDAKREARKNGQGGAIGSSAISSSRVA